VSAVTIRDVARHAGVGVGTVSRVLNSSPSVSQATRQRVLAVIEELDFEPNPIARRLSLGKTLNIAVIVPFFTRPLFVERLRGIEYALAQSEYDLVLYNVETTERRDECFREIPRRERIDGLLILSLLPQDKDVDRFLKAQVPTVLVDAHHPLLNRLVMDDVEGGRLATEHLIELGHQKIGFVGDYLENRFGFVSSRDRFEGYYQALELADISFQPKYLKQGEHSQLAARRLALELLALAERPTAIFAASDTQAIGVLMAAQELDDIEIAEYLHLSTMCQPSFVLGTEAVQLLMEAIGEPGRPPREILYAAELVARATTAPPVAA
jgi:LacI family transcriptional regulator